jgi:hypothetical protein
MTACAVPLQKLMHLSVTITGRSRTRVHSVDGRVASLEVVAGGVVL